MGVFWWWEDFKFSKRAIRADLIKKVVPEQRPERGEEVSHRGVWGKASQAEGRLAAPHMVVV